MKILITGGSSFSGYWFIKALKEKGHSITATFRGKPGQYTGIRKERLNHVANWADIVWDTSFGDEKFIELLENKYDILCIMERLLKIIKAPILI
jgi:nucleoside-diphosphate-sugar epimerase